MLKSAEAARARLVISDSRESRLHFFLPRREVSSTPSYLPPQRHVAVVCQNMKRLANIELLLFLINFKITRTPSPFKSESIYPWHTNLVRKLALLADQHLQTFPLTVIPFRRWSADQHRLCLPTGRFSKNNTAPILLSLRIDMMPKTYF